MSKPATPTTEPAAPLPQEGGSFIRQEDGTLVREEEPESPVQDQVKDADHAD